MTGTRLRIPSPTVPQRTPAGGIGGQAPERQPSARRAAVILSAVVTLALLVEATAGLVVDGLYRDAEAVSSVLRADDLVTLVVVVPALSVALAGVRRGSAAAELVWVGLLAAVVYTCAFLVFGTTFDDLFLLHVAVLSGAIIALALALASIDVAAVAGQVRLGATRHVVAGILALLALGLGGMWIYAALRFAVGGEVPVGSALVETETTVHLGIALDLVLLVPTYAAAAVLLWRRAAWGPVLAAVAVVSGLVHQIAYLVAMPFQVSAGVPGAVATDPAEPVIVALYLVAAAALFAPLAGHPRPLQALRRPR